MKNVKKYMFILFVALAFNLFGEFQINEINLGVKSVDAKTTKKITKWKNGKIKTRKVTDTTTWTKSIDYRKYNKKGKITYRKLSDYDYLYSKKSFTTLSNYGKVKKSKRTWRKEVYTSYEYGELSYKTLTHRNAKGIKYIDDSWNYDVSFKCYSSCDWYNEISSSEKIRKNKKTGKWTKRIFTYYNNGFVYSQDVIYYHVNGKAKQKNIYNWDMNGDKYLAQKNLYDKNGKYLKTIYYNQDRV